MKSQSLTSSPLAQVKPNHEKAARDNARSFVKGQAGKGAEAIEAAIQSDTVRRCWNAGTVPGSTRTRLD